MKISIFSAKMCLNGANVGIHGLFQAWFSSTGHLNMQNDQNLHDGSWLCDRFWKNISRNTFSAIFCCSEPHTADADGAGSAGCFAFTLYFLHTSHHWQHSQSCSRHKRSSLIENCSEHGFLFGRKRQKLLNTRGHKISPKALPPSSSSSSC